VSHHKKVEERETMKIMSGTKRKATMN